MKQWNRTPTGLTESKLSGNFLHTVDSPAHMEKPAACCVTNKTISIFGYCLLKQLLSSLFLAALSSHDYILKIVPTVYEDLSGRQRFSYQYTVASKVLFFPLFFLLDHTSESCVLALVMEEVWPSQHMVRACIAVLTCALTWKLKLTPETGSGPHMSTNHKNTS